VEEDNCLVSLKEKQIKLEKSEKAVSNDDDDDEQAPSTNNSKAHKSQRDIANIHLFCFACLWLSRLMFAFFIEASTSNFFVFFSILFLWTFSLHFHLSLFSFLSLRRGERRTHNACPKWAHCLQDHRQLVLWARRFHEIQYCTNRGHLQHTHTQRDQRHKEKTKKERPINERREKKKNN